jgi:hypothetical protein
MKMNNKKVIIPSILGLAAVAAISFAGASNTLAYRGDTSQKGPNYSEQRHEVMEKAFEENNYNAWKEQMNGQGRVSDVVTEENFSRFAESHRLGEAGETAKADEIRKELGLRTSNGERTGEGYGKGRGMGQGQGENRGQNNGGNFVDSNGDGKCDNLK